MNESNVTANDVLEHVLFTTPDGAIESGNIPRVNETEMPIIEEVGVSAPGKFIIVDVPETGYYTKGTNGLIVPFDVIAAAVGIDPAVFERTFTINIEGRGFDRFCCVEHNGVKYQTGSFEANAGDTVMLYANFGPQNWIKFNGQTVATGGPCEFGFIVDGDYVINLEYSPASHAHITATEAGK